jgi:hypothetical protein
MQKTADLAPWQVRDARALVRIDTVGSLAQVDEQLLERQVEDAVGQIVLPRHVARQRLQFDDELKHVGHMGRRALFRAHP